MIAAPLFDLWMDRRKSREVLGFSMVVLIFGSVIYGIAPWQTASIMLSRVLVGMAAGFFFFFFFSFFFSLRNSFFDSSNN